MQLGFLDPLASTSTHLFLICNQSHPKSIVGGLLPNIFPTSSQDHINVIRNHTRSHPQANPTISTLGSNLLRERGGWPQTLGLRRFWKSQCAIGSSAGAGGEKYDVCPPDRSPPKTDPL